MINTPEELNSIDDARLSSHVASVLSCLNDQVAPKIPKIASFVTADILLRLHNLVAEARRLGDRCGGWTKQQTLALVVATFAGVLLKKGDAEYVGNAQDYFLKHYSQHLSKAEKAEARARSRALKSGKELAPGYKKRSLELKLQIYKCKFGGVPRHGALCGPVLTQQVPFRTVEHADEVNIRLQEEIIELKHHQQSRDRDRMHSWLALTAAADQERRAREEAEKATVQAEITCAEVAARAAAQIQLLRQQSQSLAAEGLRAKGQVERLGALLGAAHIEAAKMIELKEKKIREMECATRVLADEKCESEMKAKERIKQLNLEVRAAEKECAQARGQVERLGSQLGMAHVEVARALEREEHVRQAAEQAAADAIASQVAAVAKVTADLRGMKERARDAETEVRSAKAQLERLGHKLGTALVEAARAAECERGALTSLASLKQRLHEQSEATEQEIAHLRLLKSKMAKRARDADKRAASADALTHELKCVRSRLRELRNELNSTRVQLNLEAQQEHSESELEDQESELDSDTDAMESALALKRMRAMPTWRAVRGKGCGKGEPKIEWGTRIIIYALLAMMVPASAVGMAIVAIVKRTAPWLNPTAPTCSTVQRCRFELRLVEEALAARRVASAYRIRSLGFDETTKFGNASLTSNVQIEPTAGAPLEDVILRAAYCPMGGTSELVVQSIEAKCFSRLRDLLRRWKHQFEIMCPGEAWTGPDVSGCSLGRLGGGGALISDTCNAARKAKQLLADLIASQVEEHVGAEKWAALSESERQTAVRTHQVDCWQHIRNIFLAEMSRAQAAHVQAELRAELDTFSSWERMSTEFSQLLRACFKEFHHSCRYYKGQGRSYFVWLFDEYPAAFAIHLERADGGRQDLDYDAAIPMYVNRKYFVEFLSSRVYQKGHSNILEDFLFVTFRSMQFVAMVRANAIIDLLVSRPLRWLSGKSSQLQDWSPLSMGQALDAVEELFNRAQHDGSLLLDPNLDIFKPIAETQPLFAAWRRHMFEEETVVAPDGKTKHLVWALVREELLNPADATNRATREKTIEYLEIQCAAGLRKMHDPRLALRDKLTSQDGVNCVGNSQQAHEDTLGVHATNDVLAESVFGTYDMILHRCPGISMEAASAVSQSVRSLMLSLGDHTAHRKKSCQKERKGFAGLFYALPEKEQEALVELARLTVKEMRDIDRADHRALDEYHKMRRKSNEEEELDALFTRYALAMSFFERWCKRGVQTMSEISTTIAQYGDRNQIEMRTIGLSWTEWKTPWSSSTDEDVGTVDQLRAHLKEVLAAEEDLSQRGMLPSRARGLESVEGLKEQCPAPLFQRKTFKALGTPTVQADSLSADRTEISPSELVAQAERRRAELEAAGEIDWVCDRQPFAAGQGPEPGQALVGKWIEVRWRYRHKDTGQPIYIWAEGEVVQAADGETDKRTARCTKILPAGALRIKWPADVEFDEEESFVWSILHPRNFNKDVHLGWRFAASELKRMEAAKRQPVRKKHKGCHS